MPATAEPPEVDVPRAVDEVVVLDYGGQYSQLIARRVRECGVFSELLPHHVGVEEVRKRQPKGLILSGGPASVYAEGAPKLDPALLELGIPVLGICYGMQAIVLTLGGKVEGAEVGTQILASQLELPKGSTLVTDGDVLVVNITQAVTAAEVEAELAEAEAEAGIEHDAPETPADEAGDAPAEDAADSE